MGPSRRGLPLSRQDSSSVEERGESRQKFVLFGGDPGVRGSFCLKKTVREAEVTHIPLVASCQEFISWCSGYIKCQFRYQKKIRVIKVFRTTATVGVIDMVSFWKQGTALDSGLKNN